MSYESIDDILFSWAKKNNLTMYTQDRDWEIRSFEIVDYTLNKSGNKYQIWIDKPDEKNLTTVHIWNRKPPNNKHEIKTNIKGLENVLDKALSLAIGKIKPKHFSF